MSNWQRNLLSDPCTHLDTGVISICVHDRNPTEERKDVSSTTGRIVLSLAGTVVRLSRSQLFFFPAARRRFDLSPSVCHAIQRPTSLRWMRFSSFKGTRANNAISAPLIGCVCSFVGRTESSWHFTILFRAFVPNPSHSVPGSWSSDPFPSVLEWSRSSIGVEHASKMKSKGRCSLGWSLVKRLHTYMEEKYRWSLIFFAETGCNLKRQCSEHPGSNPVYLN